MRLRQLGIDYPSQVMEVLGGAGQGEDPLHFL